MDLLFHRTTFLNSASKNVFIWFSGKTDVFWFPYFLLLTEFYTKYFCGCLRSHVIRFYLWMFHSTSFLITQEISIWYVFCNPRFLSNIYIMKNIFRHSNIFFSTTFLLCDLFSFDNANCTSLNVLMLGLYLVWFHTLLHTYSRICSNTFYTNH